MSSGVSRSYDAVVIGAGNGGMAAACQIAAAGKSVLLLEKHNIVGGFSTSFVRGRFEFEASLHELCEYGPAEDAGILRRLFDELGVEVDWIPAPEAYRLLIPSEGIDARMPFGVEEYIEAMEAYVPGSRPSMRRFFELSREAWEAMTYVQDLQTEVRHLDKLEVLRRFPNFVKCGAYPVERVYDALGLPKKARDILAAYWCYLGVPLDAMDFAFYAYVLYDYIRHKAYIPRNRSTEMALAFESRIRELGGKIETGVAVDKVLVEGGRARGVRTAAGETILARQVICNASPFRLYNEMVEPASEVPDRAKRELSSRAKSISGFVVFLGLDASREELGLKDYSTFLYDTSDSRRLYEDFSRPGRPSMQATLCLNAALPDCSPPGTTIVSMTALPKPEAWKDIAPEDYFEIKSEVASAMIADFEAATGAHIKEHIEEIEIAAPPTYSRYANSFQGLIYGYETFGADGIIPRILMMDEDLPIKGLRTASAYGARSLGYSSAMLNGRTMALYALEEMAGDEGRKS
jgi:prolycopene isomerase